MCAGGPWSVSDKTYQLMEYTEQGIVLGGPIMPVIPVICGNCGHTELINAIVAGVISPPKADESK
jgi:hypothetical protein